MLNRDDPDRLPHTRYKNRYGRTITLRWESPGNSGIERPDSGNFSNLRSTDSAFRETGVQQQDCPVVYTPSHGETEHVPKAQTSPSLFAILEQCISFFQHTRQSVTLAFGDFLFANGQ